MFGVVFWKLVVQNLFKLPPFNREFRLYEAAFQLKLIYFYLFRRQVHVAANHINSGLEDGEVIQSNPGAPKKNNAKNNSKNNSKSNSKSKNKRKSPDSEDSEIEDDIVEDEALSDITYSDDSDDQDWGKKKKKKNNNGKGGKKKK